MARFEREILDIIQLRRDENVSHVGREGRNART